MSTTWQERLRIEAREVDERGLKLSAFTEEGDGVFDSLPRAEQHELIEQLSYMLRYSLILDARVERLEN